MMNEAGSKFLAANSPFWECAGWVGSDIALIDTSWQGLDGTVIDNFSELDALMLCLMAGVMVAVY